MDLFLEGKRALVTGSNRGTGAVIARTLAREGARVAVHGNTEGDQEAVASEIAQAGGSAVAVTGDLTTDAGANDVTRAIQEAFGGLDVLVNNYGQATFGRWDDPT